MAVTQNQGAKTNQQSQNNQYGRKSGMSSVERFNSAFRSPIAAQSAGDTLQKFSEAYNETLEQISSGMASKYKLITLDTTDVSGAVQLVVLYAHENERVAFYSFILESTLRGDLQDRSIKSQDGTGTEIRIPTTAGDLYSRTMSEYVAKRISEETGVSVNRIVDAGAVTVYRELDPEATPALIHVQLWRASNSIQDLFNGEDESIRRFNLKEYADAHFRGTMQFHPGQGMNSSGLPIRRDVALTVEMGDRMNDNYDPTEFSQKHVQLMRVGAYLDFRFAGPMQGMNPMMGGMNPQMMGGMNMMFGQGTQVYLPTLYINDTNTVTNQISLELQLLALGEFLALSRNQQPLWVQMLRSSYDQSPEIANLRSFRAFKREFPEVVTDVDDPNFNLLAETQKICYPAMAHVLLCETTGDLTWIHDIFRQAANGDADSIQMIRTAADNLTNGVFSQQYPSGPIATIEQERMILGYWKSGDELRSLADIDYRAAWNLWGENDSVQALEYVRTFDPQSGDMASRVEKRLNILRSLLQGNLRVTGYAIPVMLDPNFLVALWNSIRATINVDYDSSNLGFNGTGDRSNLALLSYMLNPNAMTQMQGLGGMGGNNFNFGWSGNRGGWGSF